MSEQHPIARTFASAATAAAETSNALTLGAQTQLRGRTVVDVEVTVFSSEGDTAFVISLSDGSTLICPGVAEFDGPIARLVEMAGGRTELRNLREVRQ